MNTDVASRIAFLLETEKLKGVLRRTSPAFLERLENSAEHSWSLAIMAMLFADLADEPISLEKVLKLVAVHDLVEIHAGDTYCYDAGGNMGKAERERAAADLLFGALPREQADEFRALWDEFEAGTTPESRFANAIDRLLPLIQHRAHEGAVWKLNGITKDQVLKRIAPIGGISSALHLHALSVVDEAVGAGWIAGTEAD
ncbi:MAG: HD domain-containing protein [Chthoniobacterales bacterium]